MEPQPEQDLTAGKRANRPSAINAQRFSPAGLDGENGTSPKYKMMRERTGDESPKYRMMRVNTGDETPKRHELRRATWHAWPTLGSITLQGRYKVSWSQVLGEGSYSRVYRGLDLELCQNVAVKIYKPDTEMHELNNNLFHKTVKMLGGLTSQGQADASASKASRSRSKDGTFFRQFSDSVFTPGEGIVRLESYNDNHLIGGFRDMLFDHSQEMEVKSLAREADVIVRSLDVQACFVKLLSFSKDVLGRPGKDHDSDCLFLVLEMGDETLKDTLAECREKGEALEKEELRNMQWHLILIVCALHASGYVHLDIKPHNIMRFPGADGSRPRWKLIDLDGAMPSGVQVQLNHCIHTPQYMAPEHAQACAQELTQMTLSRLMDVWSIGLTAMEAIFLQPILGVWYNEWQEETGNDGKYLRWLGDYETDAILSGEMQEALSGIDPDMCSLLAQMLSKDPNKRKPITECVMHNWFKPIRASILEDILESSIGSGENPTVGLAVARPEHLQPIDEDSHQVSNLVSRLRAASGVKSPARTATPTAVAVSEKVSTKVCAVM